MVFSQELLEPDEVLDVIEILDRSIHHLEELSKKLNINTTIKQESQVKEDTNSNIEDKRRASTPIVERHLKMDKTITKPIVFISYTTGKIIDPNLKKYEVFSYKISTTGKLTYEKKIEHASFEHQTKKMKISFDNVSFKIFKPRLIKEICTSIQKSMKENLKRKDYEIMYDTDANQQIESKRRRHDQVEPINNVVVTETEPKIEKLEDDSELKIKNSQSRIITLYYPDY